jgi:hypothetical protein
MEDPRREHEQKHDAEREDRLNQGQRRKRQGQELERPTNACERDCPKPEWTPHEPGEKRDLDGSGERHTPRLDRLHHV